MAVEEREITASAVILEDTDSVFKSLDNKVRRMSKNLGTEVGHIHHRRSWAAFVEKMDELENKRIPTMLVICDIEDQQGQSVQNLRETMGTLWRRPPADWKGNCPIVVYTRNDAMYTHMQRIAKHAHRNASAVILQTPIAGRDPLEELRDALTDAINAL
jgi:hypothetical protein